MFFLKSDAKLRISEQNAKEKTVFLFILERKYLIKRYEKSCIMMFFLLFFLQYGKNFITLQ